MKFMNPELKPQIIKVFIQQTSFNFSCLIEAVTEAEKQEKEREKLKLNEELENFILDEEKARKELWNVLIF